MKFRTLQNPVTLKSLFLATILCCYLQVLLLSLLVALPGLIILTYMPCYFYCSFCLYPYITFILYLGSSNNCSTFSSGIASSRKPWYFLFLQARLGSMSFIFPEYFAHNPSHCTCHSFMYPPFSHTMRWVNVR